MSDHAISSQSICKQCFSRLVCQPSVCQCGHCSDILFHFAWNHTDRTYLVLLRIRLLRRYLANYDGKGNARILPDGRVDDFHNRRFHHLIAMFAAKRQFVRWLIEIGNGLRFREIIIESDTPLYLPYLIKLSEGAMCSPVHLVIGHILFHSDYYGKILMQRKIDCDGIMRANYEWIDRKLEQETLEQIMTSETAALFEQEMKRQRDMIYNGIICDNKECNTVRQRGTNEPFKQCKGCRLMRYTAADGAKKLIGTNIIIDRCVLIDTRNSV